MSLTRRKTLSGAAALAIAAVECKTAGSVTAGPTGPGRRREPPGGTRGGVA